MNSTAHVGAAGEMFACQYFLSHGLEVARNVAASGPVDIIVYNKDNGKMVPVDIKSVRSVYTRVDGSVNLGTKVQWKNDIAIAAYIHGEASLHLPEGFWAALGME